MTARHLSASLAVLLAAAAAGAWAIRGGAPPDGAAASPAAPRADRSRQAGPEASLLLPAEGRRAVAAAAAGAPLARERSAVEVLRGAAEALAEKLDPSAAPRVHEAIDLLCLLTGSLDQDSDPLALARAGVRVEVEPESVRIELPVTAGVDGQRFQGGRLELAFRLRPGDTSLVIRRILLPAMETASAADPAFSGAVPSTSAIHVDFGEWRGGDWTWELSDGWFDEPALAGLRFAEREQGDLDVAGVERGCLTADALLAWAASLPWFGAVPPDPSSQGDLARLYASAERLAASLDPARTPSLAEVADFACASATALGSGAAGIPPQDAGIAVRPLSGGVRVSVPVRAGVTSPDFRAGFLVLELSDLSSGGTLVVWRELVPALARPAPSEGPEDPRFEGEQPVSSWLELDLAGMQMTLGDVLLYSRRADDWFRTNAREGCEDLPLPFGGPCLTSERLRAWEQGLIEAAAGAVQPEGRR